MVKYCGKPISRFIGIVLIVEDGMGRTSRMDDKDIKLGREGDLRSPLRVCISARQHVDNSIIRTRLSDD